MVVDADQRQVTTTIALVELDGGMAAVVSIRNGYALGLEVDKRLEREQVQ